MGRFDVLMDMLFSFWVLKPIPDDHPKKELLRENGITFSCTCPHYNHYHCCKHCVALGLFFKTIQVPARFSTVPVGKRKAPAGASLTKRGKCLQIDA